MRPTSWQAHSSKTPIRKRPNCRRQDAFGRYPCFRSASARLCVRLCGGRRLHDGNELHELDAVVAQEPVDAPRMVAVAAMDAADCVEVHSMPLHEP